MQHNIGQVQRKTEEKNIISSNPARLEIADNSDVFDAFF